MGCVITLHTEVKEKLLDLVFKINKRYGDMDMEWRYSGNIQVPFRIQSFVAFWFCSTPVIF